MCLIVDVNVAHSLISPDIDSMPVMDWIDKGGIVVSGGKLQRELAKHNEVRRFLRVLSQKGTLRTENGRIIGRETSQIRDQCVSDDPHIIGLARVSGARLLFSRDRKLHRDFGNVRLLSRPRGKVYQNHTHQHLLLSSVCRSR